MIDFAKLTDKFSPERISWRVGSTNKEKSRGLALAYIDARDVMERLDQVCTPAGWQCRYPHANGKTVCEIGIKIGEEWIWKADGAGDTDVEAEKGALSDAFKRSAVRWGIGRYLYDIEAAWVAIVPAGKSWAIADSEYPKLRRLLGGAASPVQAQLEASISIGEVAQKIINDLRDATDLDTLNHITKAHGKAFLAMPQSDQEAVSRVSHSLRAQFTGKAA